MLAQEKHPIRAGGFVGLVLSQVDGDSYAGYHKAGLSAGLEGFIPLNKNGRLWFVTGIYYTQRGSRNIPSIRGGPYYLLKLDYVDVSFILRYEDEGKLVFASGLTIGRLVKFYEEVNSNVNNYVENPYRAMDYLFTAELRYMIGNHWFPGIRYIYSLRSIREVMPPNAPVPWQRNKALIFFLSYRI